MERYMTEHGDPVCDFHVPYQTSKQAFTATVRWAIGLNAYKRKKTSKLAKLISKLKRKNIEDKENEQKQDKRNHFKNELSSIVSKEVRKMIYFNDDSMIYVLQIFKFLHKKIENFHQNILA